MDQPGSPEIEDLRAVAARIAPFAHRTPIARCATLDRVAGRRLFFKCEHLQKTGAFKFRGACNAVLRLSPEAAARGVVTHSSGNHAAALALAARLRGTTAEVVMPSTSAAPKKRAVREYGATIVECQPTLAAREETAAQVLARTGGTLIPPYDHPDVIAGQGTAGLELTDDLPDLDVIVVPVGGGGLASGVCLAAHAHNPRLRVIGAEPAAVDDAARSLAAGQRLPQPGGRSIADGLLTSLGEHPWRILRHHLDRVITVSEEEIVAAMRLLWERAKLLVEPSAAVPLAALLADEGKRLPPGSAGVVLSGGNVDLDHLPWGA